MDDSWKSILASLDQSPVWLSQAQNGDTDAARRLLRYIAERTATGEALAQEVAEWLSTSLNAIADGDKAGGVLLLTKRRGRTPKNSAEIERLVAEYIHHSTAGRHKAISSDGELCGAYSKASQLFDISENTAEKYYKAHIDDIMEEHRIDQELRDENQ